VLALLLGPVLPPPGVAATPTRLAAAATIIHLGEHGDSGRVVFILPLAAAGHVVPQTSRVGDTLTISLPGAGRVAAPDRSHAARNVQSVAGGQDKAVLALAPGSTIRLWRTANRIVLDVQAPGAILPPRARALPGTPAPASRGAPTISLRGGVAGSAAASPAKAVITVIAQATLKPPELAPVPAVTAAPLPSAELPAAPPPFQDAAAPPDGTPTGAPAAADPLPTGGEAVRASHVATAEDAILLPFAPGIGAAGFRLGAFGHVVFDDSKAIDLAALKGDAVFGAARITVDSAATHLTMPLPATDRLALRRQPEGWIIAVQHAPLLPEVAAPARLRAGTLAIAMPQAADTVVLVDPETGGKLLVGTVRAHGPAILVPHASAEFALLPSWDGVVVRATSDRLSLAPLKDGFAIRTASGTPLSTIMADAGQAALESTGTLTRHFAISPMPVEAVFSRLEAEVAGAAVAPKQGRFTARFTAAQTMLALGMGREAAALLLAARHDDPGKGASADAVALTGMALWLANLGVPQDNAAALVNPALGNSDEVALWRALTDAKPGTEAVRAAIVAADWRLLLGYPKPLRRRLQPAAAAILIAGNQPKAAEAMLADWRATDDGPAAQAAAAGLLQAQGKFADALVILDRLAAGADRKYAAEAMRQAVELRLQTHRLDPAAAAAALDARLYTWRDPATEIELRLRIGDLRAQSGGFRAALAQLRDTERLFPEAHDRVHAAQAQTVRALLAAGGGAKLSPVDLVALVDENAELLGQPDVAASLTPVLLDKLTALDLPDRAEALVVKLLDTTTDPTAKAALGARLASLRLDQSDAAGAIAALDQSLVDDLPDAVADQRAVLRARALVLVGQDDAALRLLAGRGSDDALALQARLLEKARDWHDAETALTRLAQTRVPASGTLSDAQQDLVLRLASAASQAGDAAMLRQLQATSAPRLSPGSRTALFQALTAQPVQSVADLARSGREAEAARALPAALASYNAH
jgi:hypothetical protein